MRFPCLAGDLSPSKRRRSQLSVSIATATCPAVSRVAFTADIGLIGANTYGELFLRNAERNPPRFDSHSKALLDFHKRAPAGASPRTPRKLRLGRRPSLSQARQIQVRLCGAHCSRPSHVGLRLVEPFGDHLLGQAA